MSESDQESEVLAPIRTNRGILSQRDRTYFLDQLEVESGTAHERMIRQAIRNRLENALLDFRLLLDHVRSDDLERVVENLPSPLESNRSPLANVIGFLYVAVAYQQNETFESIVRRGTRIGAAQSNEVIQHFEFDLDTNTVEHEELLTDLVEGDGITLVEFNRLLHHDALPSPDSKTSGISLHMEFDDPVESLADTKIQLEQQK